MRLWAPDSFWLWRVFLGVPVGVGAGIYLAEYGRNRLGDVIRFTADVLNGVPSIVIGIVAYSIVVLYQKHFFRAGWRSGAGHHDDSPRFTRTRKKCCWLVRGIGGSRLMGLGIPRAGGPRSRSHCGTRKPRQSDYGNHAGPFATDVAGRNRAAVVYRVWKSVLNLRVDQPTAALSIADNFKNPPPTTPFPPMTSAPAGVGGKRWCLIVLIVSCGRRGALRGSAVVPSDRN